MLILLIVYIEQKLISICKIGGDQKRKQIKKALLIALGIWERPCLALLIKARFYHILFAG